MPPPADDDLPVADAVPPADPMPVADPVGPDDDLPVAVPVAAPIAPPPGPRKDAPPVRPVPPSLPKPPTDSGPPKPRMMTACCVIGCFGGAMVAALSVVAVAAVVLVGQLSKVAKKGTEPDEPATTSAAERPGPIHPTRLAQDRYLIKLPGNVTAVGRGGNGRYLLLAVPGQILVFDPNDGAMVSPFTFDATDARLVFAAGATDLFVHRQGRLERYNLVTRELKKTAPWPNAPAVLAIGPGADGPLFALTPRGDDTEVTVIDAVKLELTGPPTTVTGARVSPGGRSGVRVSNDGRLIGIGVDSGGRGGTLVRFGPGGTAPSIVRLAADDMTGHAAPAADGRLVFTPRGVFTPDGKLALGPKKANPFLYTLPAAHGGDLFLSLDTARSQFTGPARLHLTQGDRQPVGVLPGVEVPADWSPSDPESIPADLRVHFWPAAGVVAVLKGQTQLDVYRVDVPAVLRNSGTSYVVFGSDPPTAATRRTPYMYTPIVWASADEAVTFQVVTEAVGVQMNGGVLQWTPPADGPSEVEIVLRATGEGGRTAEQKFRIAVTNP